MAKSSRGGQTPEDPGDREASIRRILEQVERKLRKDFNDEAVTLDEIEDNSEEIGEAVKRLVNEEALRKRQGKDAQQAHAARCGCCRRKARYVERRPRQIVLRSGVIRICRAYYHCKACGTGFAPLDQLLGIGRGACSRRVAALIARLSCYLPDRLVAQELEQSFGLRLAISTVQRYSRSVGAAMERQWRAQAIQDVSSLPVSSERPSRLHVTMDGVMLHVDGRWQEAKLGSAYQTTPSGHATKARYYATMARSRPFGRRLRVLAHRSGADRCRDVATIGDGADWIWQEVGKHFPQSTQVLDYFHVVEHLWEAARLRFGEGSAAAAEWMKEQKASLLEDKVDAVIASVSTWRPRKHEKLTVRRRLLAFLTEHRHRIQYKTLADAGYHIGSGVAESGCKNVVQIRMKRAGMRWSNDGADRMLHLCAWFASHDRPSLDHYVRW